MYSPMPANACAHCCRRLVSCRTGPSAGASCSKRGASMHVLIMTVIHVRARWAAGGNRAGQRHVDLCTHACRGASRRPGVRLCARYTRYAFMNSCVHSRIPAFDSAFYSCMRVDASSGAGALLHSHACAARGWPGIHEFSSRAPTRLADSPWSDVVSLLLGGMRSEHPSLAAGFHSCTVSVRGFCGSHHGAMRVQGWKWGSGMCA